MVDQLSADLGVVPPLVHFTNFWIPPFPTTETLGDFLANLRWKSRFTGGRHRHLHFGRPVVESISLDDLVMVTAIVMFTRQTKPQAPTYAASVMALFLSYTALSPDLGWNETAAFWYCWTFEVTVTVIAYLAWAQNRERGKLLASIQRAEATANGQQPAAQVMRRLMAAAPAYSPVSRWARMILNLCESANR